MTDDLAPFKRLYDAKCAEVAQLKLENARLKASLTTEERTEFNLVELYERSIPDDLRDKGLTVAVHNDYRQNGTRHTFWLMTLDHKDQCLAFKGEGETDAIALDQIRTQVNKILKSADSTNATTRSNPTPHRLPRRYS